MPMERRPEQIKMKEVMLVLYCNHSGKVEWRYVRPLGTPPELGSPYHPDEWVFRVWDLGKQAERSYSFGGILWCGPVSRKPPTHFTIAFGHPPSPPELG